MIVGNAGHAEHRKLVSLCQRPVLGMRTDFWGPVLTSVADFELASGVVWIGVKHPIGRHDRATYSARYKGNVNPRSSVAHDIPDIEISHAWYSRSTE